MREFECPDDILKVDSFGNQDQKHQTIIDFSRAYIDLLKMKKQFIETDIGYELVTRAIKTRKEDLELLSSKRFVSRLKGSFDLVARGNRKTTY